MKCLTIAGMLLATTVPAAMAQPVAYFDAETRSFFVVGLNANDPAAIDYTEGRDRPVRVGQCREAIVRNAYFRIEVNGQPLLVDSLPEQLLPPCVNGQFLEARPGAFRQVGRPGTVVLVNQPGTFTIVRTSQRRNGRANACGMAVFKPTRDNTHESTDLVGITGGPGYWQDVSAYPVRPIPLCRQVDEVNSVLFAPEGSVWLESP